MQARDRFISALAERVSDAYYAEGDLYVSVHEVEAIAGAEKVSDSDARSALALLEQNGLLSMGEGGHHFRDGIALMLRFEHADRRLFWERNKLRREILRLAAAKFDEGRGDLRYLEGEDQFIDSPWAETYAASLSLQHMYLLEVNPFMGHNFRAAITAEGYELQRSEAALARKLPISAADDEDAAANVASDVLGELIRDVDELLTARGWTGAASELRRGDDEYSDGDWTNAVREYYSALESGLKHRLDEAGVAHSAGAALKDLAKQAAAEALIPTNYQALFGFTDTIRSPRSHGRGNKINEIEVGKAEALLMANHVRALLVYLGHRP